MPKQVLQPISLTEFSAEGPEKIDISTTMLSESPMGQHAISFQSVDSKSC